MKFGKTSLVLAILGLFSAYVTRDATANKPDPPPAPGIKGEITVAGEEMAGAVVRVTCRFVIPKDAYAVTELRAWTGKDGSDWRTDSVIFYSSEGVQLLGDTVWIGVIEPGVVYEFSASAQLTLGFESKVFAKGNTRYGREFLGKHTFFLGLRPRILGFVIDTIVDSSGDRTHHHRWITDTLIPGFTFDTSGMPRPDTTFDSLGRVKFIIKSVLDIKSLPFRLPGPTPKVRLVGTTKRKVPTKPSGSSNQQSSILVPERNATT